MSVKKDLNVEKPGIEPVWKSWSAPPALYACGRYGLANRRSLTGAGAIGVGVATVPDFVGLTGCCDPADAGAVGFGSALVDRLSSRSTCLSETVCDFGTGYWWASFFRRPYVYVLP